MYAGSYDLAAREGIDLPTCEVDFVMIRPRTYPDRAEVLIGECKDEGGTIDANDIQNLKRVADAFPRDRFSTYVVLSKLSPFTDAEIELARTLNERYRRRVILLTARELEPYFMFERVKKELGLDLHGGTAEELARATAQIYFRGQDDARAGLKEAVPMAETTTDSVPADNKVEPSPE